MADILVIAAIALILAAAAGYIITAKKKGAKCIGCPSAGSCSAKSCGGCSCSCGTKKP